MSEWKEIELGKLCNFVTGKLNSNAAEANGIYPFFTCSPETYKINKYAFDCEAILLAGNNANAKYSLKYYKGKFNAYQRTYVITVKNKSETDYKYLFYSLNLKLNYLKDISQGSATQFLTIRILNDLSIKQPHYSEQKVIASILSSLDSKIDLLRKQNQTLENIAQTLFKRWFVDFEFPDENDKPYKSSGGKMVASELGEIPEGWKVGVLADVTREITDGAHLSPATTEKGLPMASVKDMKSYRFDIDNCRRISEADYEQLVKNGCKPEVGDLLIAKDGSFLKHSFVFYKEMDIAILSSIAILRPNSDFSSILLGLMLKQKSVRYRLENLVSGAVIQRIVLKDFKKFEIVIPSNKIHDELLEKIKPLIQKCWNNEEELLTLTIIRDILLPKLMSGQIRVPVCENNAQARKHNDQKDNRR